MIVIRHSARSGETSIEVHGKPAGTFLPLRAEGLRARDRIREVRPGLVSWRRTVKNTAGAEQEVRLSLEFRTAYEPTYRMIPAVSYDGNLWGSGSEPKGFARDGVPWVFASHRTAVPGCTYSEGDGISVTLFGPISGSTCGFSCSLAPEPGRVVHRLIWPEEESPEVYSARDTYSAAYRGSLRLGPRESIRLEAWLVVARVDTPRFGWRRALDHAWHMGPRDSAMPRSPEELWRLGVAFAKQSLWAEEGTFRGFSIGLSWRDGAWRQREKWRYEIGWCGQNASLAASLIHDHLADRDSDSLERGLAALDSWVAHGTLPNGLIRCHFDFVLGLEDPAREVQDACNLGQAAGGLLDAADLASRAGAERPAWREAALRLCDFVTAQMQPDGRLGKAWRNDGTCVDPNGTIGAFLIPPLVRAERLTGEARYLDAAKLAYRFYASLFERDGYTTAGALDTHCIDKESAIPLLEGGLALFERTEDRHYLAAAELAAAYLSTWQWHHSPGYPAGTALGDMGYDARGGTSVSTQHHHHDPYGLAFVNAWLRLTRITGDATWRERARAVWRNGMSGISDGNLSIMGKLRPAGGQDEGFLHTRWGDAFNVSQWLVAWTTAFRLEVLRKAKGWEELR
jgi:hypothetical protein